MSSVEEATLIRARQRFSDLDHVPLGLVVLDSQLHILFWNGSMEDWTGITRTQAVGFSMASLNSHWAHSRYAGRLAHLFEGGPPVVFSPLLHPRIVPRSAESGRTFHVKAAAVPDGQGGWWAFLSVEDVSALQRRVEELKVMRLKQDRLMREIHHRVKNNLNMISGLITLQKSQSSPGIDTGPLEDLQSRIVAISEIHDILYHSSDLSAGSTAEYLEALARLLDANLSMTGTHQLVLDLDPTVVLKTDSTVLLGLVQAELMTNALKYGLGKGTNEKLEIRLSRTGPREYQYLLSHSGDRLPENFDPNTSEGLGMLLLTAYADQLGTKLGWSRGDPTQFWLRFTE